MDEEISEGIRAGNEEMQRLRDFVFRNWQMDRMIDGEEEKNMQLVKLTYFATPSMLTRNKYPYTVLDEIYEVILKNE